MSKELVGVRADYPYSYRQLEKLAAYVRRQLGVSPHEAIAPLKLFEGLDDITIHRRSEQPVPLRHGVISIEDSEGYTKYDSEQGVIEVLASEKTYNRLEQGHPRGTYFVAHELGHCHSCCISSSSFGWPRCRRCNWPAFTAAGLSTSPTKTRSGRRTRLRARS